MKLRYSIQITYDDSGRVVITLPAFPDIRAEAFTKEQAIQFARTIVKARLQRLRADGRSFPESDAEALEIEI